MGWGERRLAPDPPMHPTVAAAHLGLVAAVRRFLKHGTTGNLEALRAALAFYDDTQRRAL
jgi:hypothetical protein